MLKKKLKELWRGEIQLFKTYWVYGILINIISSAFCSLLEEIASAMDMKMGSVLITDTTIVSFLFICLFGMLVCILFFGYEIIISVGT